MNWRRLWMVAGFVAAGAGDWLLAIRGASSSSVAFLFGVVCFLTAHVMWTAGQLRDVRPDWRVMIALAVPLVVFSAVRLRAVLPSATLMAVCAYSLVSAFSFCVAFATRRRFYAWGIGLLLVSDVMIGGRLLGVPGCGMATGPLYIAAETCLLLSFFMRKEPVFGQPRQDALANMVMFGVPAAACFVSAAVCFPGGGYNPFMRMLSALGRTMSREVEWPWCHYLFIAGMVLSSIGLARLWRHLVLSMPLGRRRSVLSWSAAANVSGLLTIAMVPENVDMFFHNVGCWMAALGGCGALFSLEGLRGGRMWTCLLSGIAAAFGIACACHGIGLAPFAPWVPSLQKAMITAFAVWTFALAARSGSLRVGGGVKAVACAAVALAAVFSTVHMRCSAGVPLDVSHDGLAESPGCPRPKPLNDEEVASLRWLDHVTGPLPDAVEKEWWNIGGSQHGLFAKRYNIAFCGYAAAALGMRGDAEQRRTTGRILGNCIKRFLKRDAWAYSMSRSYWGRKPWAPDPCRRENVMYTGHLLQLLALYETFTGDRRFWTEGFDFVWNARKRVHYDVGRLIDVTVRQMRKGPNGGVACEPGLMFFPCNNHPHIALTLFSRLGHGDWEKDARRWERWATSHYARPMFGGGSLNLVYHARSGLFFPRGHSALDAWSLLWYEPWAADRRTAYALWRMAAENIDWKALSEGQDGLSGKETCCNPVEVPPAVTAAFLAAAARACGDAQSGDRLEGMLTRFLEERDGMAFLDIGREWRIGSMANLIIARAIANGSSFRRLVGGGLPQDLIY